MATNNSSNNQYANNADGFTLGGGTTSRSLTVTGGNMTLTGAGSNTYTLPASTDTLVGRASTDTLTNKSITLGSNTLTNPYAFYAYQTAAQTVNSFTKMTVDTVSYDDNSNFNTTTNRYVAPVSGKYHFDGRVSVTTSSLRLFTLLYVNGTAMARGTDFTSTSAVAASNVSADLKLNATDYVELYAFTSGSVAATPGSTVGIYLDGHFIGV